MCPIDYDLVPLRVLHNRFLGVPINHTHIQNRHTGCQLSSCIKHCALNLRNIDTSRKSIKPSSIVTFKFMFFIFSMCIVQSFERLHDKTDFLKRTMKAPANNWLWFLFFFSMCGFQLIYDSITRTRPSKHSHCGISILQFIGLEVAASSCCIVCGIFSCFFLFSLFFFVISLSTVFLGQTI